MGFNKDDLFNSYTLSQDTVEVERWGGEVRVQEISAQTIEELRNIGEGKELKAACTIIIAGVIDEDGNKVFNKKDIDKLMQMSVSDLNTVSEAILKISGLNPAGDDEESEGK